MSRRAAIIPGGWTAIVVAEQRDDESTLRPILAESFEVGRIVNDELGEKRREWNEADVELAVRRLMQRLIELQADSVVIEWATSKTSKNHALASAIEQACAASNIACSYAKRWRLWNTMEHRAWTARRILEGFEGWPSGTFTVTRDCGVMLLESISPERPVQLPPVPKEGSHVPNLESSDAKIEAAPVTPGELSLKRRGEKKKPAAPVVLLLPRTAGIDPGAGYLGLVITEGSTVPVQLVHKVTFPVGERVPLKRPRKIKRGEETITLTTRHSLTAPMARTLANKIVARLIDYRVTRLAIEHVEAVHIEAKNPGAASSIATSLIRTSWLDILIGERAEAAGIEVHRVSASTWRARVAGRRKRGGAGAELIPEAVASKIRGWPPESDAHERDAAGVNLWLVLPPPESPPLAEKRSRGLTSKTKTPREPGTRPPSYYARLERLRNEKARTREEDAAGCLEMPPIDRKFLRALALEPKGFSKSQLLALTGHQDSGSVRQSLARLRRQNHIIGGARLRITPAGLATVGIVDATKGKTMAMTNGGER
jgi:hypothetical protein